MSIFAERRVARALAGGAAGFALGAVLWNFALSDPTVELPAVAVPPDPLPAVQGLAKEPGPRELRAFVVGASMTAGYPYQPLGAASFATLLGKGLAELFPERTIRIRPAAKPALDSPKLAAIHAKLLAWHPSFVLVVLGTNELANRVFSGKRLVPDSAWAALRDRCTRARRLWHLLEPWFKAGRARQRSERELEAQIVRRIYDARPGRPALGALPVEAVERAHLRRRLARAMRRMSAAATRAGVPLVFAIGPYDLAGSWPWGLGGQPAARAAIDGLVHRFRRHPESVRLPEVERLSRAHPRAAELRHLAGRLLLQAGRPEGARRAFVEARDLDPVPMHLTSAIEGVIRETAAALGRPVIDLNELLGRGRPAGLPDPALFLDYGHLREEGHALLARRLAVRLAELGLLPRLGNDYAEAFARAARRQFARELDQLYRRRAPVHMAFADGNFALLFGNFRDGLAYLERAFAGDPTDPEIAFRLIFCVDTLAGRLDLWRRGNEEERRRRLLAVYGGLRTALAQGKLAERIDRLLPWR